jgi:hypothetical protein
MQVGGRGFSSFTLSCLSLGPSHDPRAGMKSPGVSQLGCVIGILKVEA